MKPFPARASAPGAAPCARASAGIARTAVSARRVARISLPSRRRVVGAPEPPHDRLPELEPVERALAPVDHLASRGHPDRVRQRALSLRVERLDESVGVALVEGVVPGGGL